MAQHPGDTAHTWPITCVANTTEHATRHTHISVYTHATQPQCTTYHIHWAAPMQCVHITHMEPIRCHIQHSAYCTHMHHSTHRSYLLNLYKMALLQESHPQPQPCPLSTSPQDTHRLFHLHTMQSPLPMAEMTLTFWGWCWEIFILGQPAVLTPWWHIP